MRHELLRLLPSFHKGSLQEADRLRVERELLVDPEYLIEYFDLKREMEFATRVPAGPSPRLWQRLRLDPALRLERRTVLSLSLGALLAAACLAVLFFLKFADRDTIRPLSPKGTLFDSKSELPVSSNVL